MANIGPVPTGYNLHILRSAADPNWVRVELRKSWWHYKRGYASRRIAFTTFYAVDGQRESVLVADALREILLALEDRLS